MKTKLSFNKIDLENHYQTLGLNDLTDHLINSNLFDIDYHNERIHVGDKGMRGLMILCGNKKVYLDFWEYSLPSYSKPIYDYNFDLIIKLQTTPMTYERYQHACNHKKVLNWLDEKSRWDFYNKIIPWTFFPSRMMKQFVGKEETLHNNKIERDGFFCGKGWKCRSGMSQSLSSQNIEYVRSSQELRDGRPLSDEEYLHKMKTSKFGIVLHGRGSYFTEAKNRREIDYMMMKKPLCLNYRPYYYNGMIDGKHYIYIDGKTDWKNIEKMYNIEEIANNGYQWYKDNASPMGSALTFSKILSDKFGDKL